MAVADLVDLFVLVASPAGGDELQGIKRGIMELADLIVVNKADGDLVAAAERADGRPPQRRAPAAPQAARVGGRRCATCSALTGAGVPELWTAIVAARARLDGEPLEQLRARQGVAWMWSEVTDTLLDRLRAHPGVPESRWPSSRPRSPRAGRPATTAAHELLEAFLGPDDARY